VSPGHLATVADYRVGWGALGASPYCARTACSGTAGFLKGLFEMLPALCTGEAVIVGEAKRSPGRSLRPSGGPSRCVRNWKVCAGAERTLLHGSDVD